MIANRIYKKIKDKKRSKGKSERHSRSFIKAISWRIIGTLDTIFIAWLISGKFSIAFSIGAFELATKTILYYFHERLWNFIRWGK